MLASAETLLPVRDSSVPTTLDDADRLLTAQRGQMSGIPWFTLISHVTAPQKSKSELNGRIKFIHFHEQVSDT